MSLRNIFQGLAELVFPSRCISCGSVIDAEKACCPDCLAGIRFIGSPLCICCGVPFDETGGSDHLCGECLTSPPVISSARAVGRYEDVLLDLVHKFKYGGKTAIGEKLGKLMAEFSYPAFDIRDYSLIMPVPLHRKRLRQRGFNQAVILAREIAVRFAMVMDVFNLRRIAPTDSQVRLGREEREANVRAAFALADAKKVSGRRIVLVDDVYTTGSTVKECARILLKSGAESVAVLTLARAV